MLDITSINKGGKDMSEKKNTKLCTNCDKEVAAQAVVCPECGVALKKKKPFYKKWWVWAIVIIVVVIAATSGGGSEAPAGGSEPVQQEQNIDYTAYLVDEMVKELGENALKAEKKYMDQYVEITGKLSNIDSDGSYISLGSTDPWEFTTVTCYIKNDAQLEKVMEMSTGDTVTLTGKVTSVGEVLGYNVDIAEIK